MGLSDPKSGLFPSAPEAACEAKTSIDLLVRAREELLLAPAEDAAKRDTLILARAVERAISRTSDSIHSSLVRAGCYWNALAKWASNFDTVSQRACAVAEDEPFAPLLSVPVMAFTGAGGGGAGATQPHPARVYGYSWLAWAIRARASSPEDCGAVHVDMLRAAGRKYYREIAPIAAAQEEAGEIGEILACSVRAAVQWAAVDSVLRYVVGDRRVELREMRTAPEDIRLSVCKLALDAVSRIGDECARETALGFDIVSRYKELYIATQLPIGFYAAANRSTGLSGGIAVPPGRSMIAVYTALGESYAIALRDIDVSRVASMCADVLRFCVDVPPPSHGQQQQQQQRRYKPAKLVEYGDWTRLSNLVLALFATRAAAVSGSSAGAKGPRKHGEQPDAHRDSFSAHHFFPLTSIGYQATEHALRVLVRSHRVATPRLVQVGARFWCVQAPGVVYLFDCGAAALAEWHKAAYYMYGGVDDSGSVIPRLCSSGA